MRSARRRPSQRRLRSVSRVSAVSLLIRSDTSFSLQAEAAEMDGFQADTEEDEEDDDCMIVDIQPGKGGENKSVADTCSHKGEYDREGMFCSRYLSAFYALF